MAIPTREDIITFAQSLLTDSAGEVFTSSVLSEPFGAAFTEMTAEMAMNQVPYAKREVWCNLAAYTSMLTPAVAGIADFGEIIKVEERDVSTSTTITGATNATPIVVTAAGHSVSTNQEVIVSGVVGNTAANGRWFATVSGSSITLVGSAGNAAYGSGGTITTSSDRYTEVQQVTELPQYDPGTRLLYYVWEGDTFYLIGSTAQRQLRITYYSSGAAPASGSTGIDGCKNFVSYRTAAISAGSLGYDARAGVLDQAARGSRPEAGAAGYLFQLIQPMVRAMQRQPIQPRAYQIGRRNNLPGIPDAVIVSAAGNNTTMPYQWFFASQTIDGSNATFTTDRTPVRMNLFKNGVRMNRDTEGAATTDFSMSGQTITFVSGAIPQSGDSLMAEYWA